MTCEVLVRLSWEFLFVTLWAGYHLLANVFVQDVLLYVDAHILNTGVVHEVHVASKLGMYVDAHILITGVVHEVHVASKLRELNFNSRVGHSSKVKRQVNIRFQIFYKRIMRMTAS